MPQPNQLFINPYECVDCGLCVPECPWEAIFSDEELPARYAADVEVNARCRAHPEEYRIADPVEGKPKPTPAEVAANRDRWERAAS